MMSKIDISQIDNSLIDKLETCIPLWLKRIDGLFCHARPVIHCRNL